MFCVKVAGIFADSRVTALDGLTVIPGGWINRHYRQLGIQLANGVAIVSYTAVMTLIILVVIDYIPGLSLRASEEAEIIGIDEGKLCQLISTPRAHVSYSYRSVWRAELRLCLPVSGCRPPARAHGVDEGEGREVELVVVLKAQRPRSSPFLSRG